MPFPARRSDTCSVGELRRRTGACVEAATASGRPLFITRRGEPVAVLMSLQSYEALIHETTTLRAALGGHPRGTGR